MKEKINISECQPSYAPVAWHFRIEEWEEEGALRLPKTKEEKKLIKIIKRKVKGKKNHKIEKYYFIIEWGGYRLQLSSRVKEKTKQKLPSASEEQKTGPWAF